MTTDLKTRWLKLCQKVGRSGEKEWNRLYADYTEAGLAYHNLSHIDDCLNQFSECSELANNETALEFAIWFHDVIYDPKADDNEARSAQRASEFLAKTLYAHEVSELILATSHQTKACSPDAQLICDIDLSILGARPSDYLIYANAIRQEYAWVSQSDYEKGRGKVLRQFLTRDSIYSTQAFREKYENQARSNLTQELETLSG